MSDHALLGLGVAERDARRALDRDRAARHSGRVSSDDVVVSVNCAVNVRSVAFCCLAAAVELVERDRRRAAAGERAGQEHQEQPRQRADRPRARRDRGVERRMIAMVTYAP